MKKRIISCLSLSSLMAIGLSVVFLNVSKKVEKTEGYSTSSLPTTIDLNDSSANDIREYYSDLDDLAVNERKGNNLLKNLKDILKRDQKYYAYDGTSEGRKIWQIYEISDRDWTKSPASEISGYNANTNKITGYTYGTSYSAPGTNPYLHSLYVDRDVENLMRAWKKDNDTEQQNNHGGNAEWYIDREHIWPKSQGFEANGNGGARGDPMHLWSGDSDVNSSAHNNNFYGYVNTSISYSKGKWSYAKKNYSGTSLTLGTGDTVFEPQDCDKGDIARAVFYMVARYNYLSGEDEAGIDTNNPNLALEQANTIRSSYTSSTSVQGKMGILTDLLAWHKADPVDEWEIHRNNLLYKNYTNNRNPFIDFPEWVDYIWGTATYNGRNYVSYSSTPTGCATPSSDTINGYNSSDPVAVTGVSVSPAQTSIYVGGHTTLTATVTPSNATNKNVTWTTSNSSVATVTNGTVTGVATGSATITATTSDGGFTASCTVTVSASGGSTETDSGSVTASEGKLSGWTADGTGTKYADGSVKFDSTGDNVYKTDIFSAEVASGMTELTVTINGKINGTPNADNSYRVDALDSGGNVLSSATKTGANIYNSGDYVDAVFTISTNLTGCTGFKVTYATKGSGNWGVMTVSWTAKYVTAPVEPTSISAVVNDDKTFYVGETITKSDITVTTDTGIDVTELASFSDYKFTYADAASGGALTDKELTNAVSYDTFHCSLTAKVQRKAKITPDTISDTLTRDLVGVTAKTYENWEGVSDVSNAVYAGQSCGTYEKGTDYVESIQIRSNNDNSGIVSTTSGGKLKSVSISFNSFTSSTRTVNIYGSNNPYTSPTELYNSATQGTLLGTIVKGTSTSLNISGSYKYIGIRSNSGAIYIDEINIVYYGQESAVNVANYIMYEDTAGQCNTKTDIATGYFEDMSQDERTLFMTSSDYVISTARARLNAWLANQGKAISYSNNDYVIQGAKNVGTLFESNTTIIIVVIFSSVGVLSLLGYFYFRRKKGTYHA